MAGQDLSQIATGFDHRPDAIGFKTDGGQARTGRRAEQFPQGQIGIGIEGLFGPFGRVGGGDP